MPTAPAAAAQFADLEAKCSLIAGCPVELTHMGGAGFSMVADGDRRAELNGLRSWLVAAAGHVTPAEFDAEANCSMIYITVRP